MLPLIANFAGCYPVFSLRERALWIGLVLLPVHGFQNKPHLTGFFLQAGGGRGQGASVGGSESSKSHPVEQHCRRVGSSYFSM